jgi:hypothetical protein
LSLAALPVNQLPATAQNFNFFTSIKKSADDTFRRFNDSERAFQLRIICNHRKITLTFNISKSNDKKPL